MSFSAPISTRRIKIFAIFALISIVGVSLYLSLKGPRPSASSTEASDHSISNNSTTAPSSKKEASQEIQKLEPISQELNSIISIPNYGEDRGFDDFERNLSALEKGTTARADLGILIASNDIRIRAIAVSLDTRLFEGGDLPRDFIQRESQPYVLSAYLISELLWGSKERWAQASRALAQRFPPDQSIENYFKERSDYFTSESPHLIQGSASMSKLFIDGDSPAFFLQSLAYNSPPHRKYYSDLANTYGKGTPSSIARRSVEMNSILGVPFLMYSQPPKDESTTALIKSGKIDLMALPVAASIRLWQP